MRFLKGLFLLTLSLAVGFIAWDLHQGLRSIVLMTGHFDDLVTDVSVDYAFKTEKVSHLLDMAQFTADEAGIFALEQRKQLAKTSLDSDKTVKALRLTIDRAGLLLKHTDEQLNIYSLPRITASAQIGMKAIADNADKIGLSADAVTAAGNSLNLRFRDPRLDTMLDAYNAAAFDFQGSMGHVDHMLGYADKQLTTPVGFWKNLLLHEVLPAAGSAGSFIQGFVNK